VSATFTIPADVPAEQSLLGACLLSENAVEVAANLLAPEDFYKPAHQHIFTAILVARRRHAVVDYITVAATLTEAGFADETDCDISYLQQLTGITPSTSGAIRYAEIVADRRLRTRLVYAAAEITDLATGAGLDAIDAAERSRELLADLDTPLDGGRPDVDVDSFIAATVADYDWLIPDVLEVRDRLLITAGEGAGKSVLLAQLAVMTAAGIHPWTRDTIPARNVALIDLENGPRLLARRLAGLRHKAGSRLDPTRLRIHCRPDGINLTARADARWLIERCAANRTELLVIGPTYRMSAGPAAKGDIGGEDQARTITAALDELRHRCNVTVVMETHAPHGSSMASRDLRPFGSSVWLRWPEFGIGLRRNGARFDVIHWRGARDHRLWPTQLTRGGTWPWTAVLPTGGGHRPPPVDHQGALDVF
jgi:hypothetical protein